MAGVPQATDRRLQSLLANATDIVVLLDCAGAFEYASPSAQRILGYALDDVAGRPATAFVHPEDCFQVDRAFAAALRSPGASQPPLVYRVRHRDGTWLLMEAIVTNLLDDGDVGSVVVNCRDITVQQQVQQQLRYTARHDLLTGLPNRQALIDRLQALLSGTVREASSKENRPEPRRPFALLLLDVDRFKRVNSSFGHDTGDRLLVAIAHRLRAGLKQTDTVARLGGDEFALLLENVSTAERAAEVAERVRQTLRTPFRLGDCEVFVSASIGLVLGPDDTTGDDCPSPQDLLRDADTAMYRAKELGVASYLRFDRAMRDRAAISLQTESELWRAIERDELRVRYQPIVSLGSGRVWGFEALVRWQHPRRGLLGPKEFVAVAAESGLLVRLDEWVLREACGQWQKWQQGQQGQKQRQGQAQPPGQANCAPTSPAPSDARPGPVLSVNLSGLHFSNPQLPDRLARICWESGVDPSAIEIELTESFVMAPESSIAANLESLRALGFGIAIDDFGTGYSSLSRLHRFPIDTLKIDRAFVTPIQFGGVNGEIARTIAALAHNLDMVVVAEGVETPEQALELRAMGCEFGQGFLFSPPVDGETAATLGDRPLLSLLGDRATGPDPASGDREASPEGNRAPESPADP